MFLKLLLIILTIGGTASSLLVMRQQKVETIHDISGAYHRLRENERTLWMLQVEVARRNHPEELRRRLINLDLDWQPIPAAPPVPLDSPGSDPSRLLIGASDEPEFGNGLGG